MQTHFSERQSFAVQSRSSVFTYGNDEYKRDEIGRQDGLSGTLKPAPKGNLLELHESDCGFESHRTCTLSYKNTLTSIVAVLLVLRENSGFEPTARFVSVFLYGKAFNRLQTESWWTSTCC